MNGNISCACGIECIWNTRLIDEALDCPGAVVLKNGKILAVLQGNFSREPAVYAAAAVAGVPVDSVTVTDAAGFCNPPEKWNCPFTVPHHGTGTVPAFR